MTAAPPLPGVLGSLAPLLDHYGYLAVAALVTVEDFGVPVPGETVLIAAAVYAGAGRLNIVAVALLGFTAAVVGDNIGFAIGHFGGRPLALRVGGYVFLTPARLDRAQALGYAAGNHIGAIYTQVTRYELYLLIAVAVAISALITRHLIRRRAAGSPPDRSGP